MKDLIKVARKLESLGLAKESSALGAIIRKIGGFDPDDSATWKEEDYELYEHGKWLNDRKKTMLKDTITHRNQLYGKLVDAERQMEISRIGEGRVIPRGADAVNKLRTELKELDVAISEMKAELSDKIDMSDTAMSNMWGGKSRA